MNRSSDQQRQTPEVETAAARWFVRLQDTAATGDDWLEFETWLRAAPDHAAAYERLESLWGDLDDAEAELSNSLNAPISLETHRVEMRRGAHFSRRLWLAAGAGLAASVALAVVGVANWPQPSGQTYSTAPGETRQIALADGTKIWLNAASRIDVRLKSRVRQVEMADGEAVFDVAHDPERPFLIATDGHEVRVVGTQFNLRQRDGAFALTVRRGVVEVRPADAADATPTRVTAGQQLVQPKGAASAILATKPPDGAFAWTRGQLVYSGATIKEVAADLSRSLGAPVRVADVATGRIGFSGVLVLDDRDAVLHRLEAFAPVRARRSGDGIVLSRR